VHPDRRWLRLGSVLSLAVSSLLIAAAVWYALYSFDVSAPALPAWEETRSEADNLRSFFAYERSHAWQEVGYTLLAAIAFLLLAPLGPILREILGPDEPEAALGSSLFVVAAALLVSAQLLQIGTISSVLEESERSSSDPLALDVAWETGFEVSNWLENGGYASLAVAIAAWALAARRGRTMTRAWFVLSGVLAIALLVVVTGQAFEVWDVYDVALSVSGAVLAPAWFLLLARAWSTR
jgi:hypothetical protein